MNEIERWHEGNDRYLALALAWLRLRLARAAAASGPDPAPGCGPASGPDPRAGGGEAPEPSPARGRMFFARHGAAAPRPERPSPDPPTGRDEPAVAATTADEAAADEAAAEAMAAAAAALSPPPALERIAARLGLSPFERDVLLLCASAELDTRVPDLCAAASGQAAPTFALAMGMLDSPTWDVLSPAGPLRYWYLVEAVRPAGQPLTTSPLRADERTVNAIKGLDHLDDRLAPLVAAVDLPDGPLPPSQESVVRAALDALEAAVGGGRLPLLDLVGPDAGARERVAARIAAAVGLAPHRLTAQALPTVAADIDLLARLWQREAALSPVALYIDAAELDDPATSAALSAFLRRTGGLLLVGGPEVRPDLPGRRILLDVGRPTSGEQRAAWDEALTGATAIDTGSLVEQFDLDTAAITEVAATVTGPAGGGEVSFTRLWDACRAHARPRLESLAQRVEPVAAWRHLVLPDAQTALLHQIADQVGQRARVYGEWGFGERMNRGLGIGVLFAGESGTGKSMAAEVLANALRLDLYRIDLSSVVSKYVGETEKNLRRLFDAADTGGLILFFDEADALFGKRSEVKDAHDRYANIEVNYLLQRMEAYQGLAILATNMKSAMDRAFTRRLRFVVPFPFPSAEDRARMWDRVFPGDTPVEGLDTARLARLNLTGAAIHNAALNAAFLAASAGRAVGMRDVLDAARSELRKLDRPVTEADFRLEVPA